jgi:hypothetical protein
MQELEHLRSKFEIASAATEGFFSKRWISKNVFNQSDEEFLRNQREAFYDRKYQSMIEAIAEAAAGEGGTLGGGALGELGGGELGDDLGGGELGELGTGELGGAVEEPAGGAEEGDASALLAAPARREDDVRHYEKSTYNPVKKIRDRRKTNKSGPTTRKTQSSLRPMKTSARRDIFKGADLLNINALYENEDPIYNDLDEHRLLESTGNVRRLISQLEEKDKDTEAESSESEAQ